jgi:TatD DNase family protein
VIIDTHAHIYLPDFNQDLTQVMHRAAEVGVQYMLLPNVDETTISAMHQVCDRYPDRLFPMMGLHPCSVKQDNFEALLDVMRQHLFKPVRKYWAVGEIGLDLYWDKSTLDIQITALEQQITWAKALDLPVVFHVRDAFPEIFEVVDRLNDDRLKGVFHCFTGSSADAQHILSYGGFKLGIGGVLTFKNGRIDQFIREIGLEHLVLETDSPYLAPNPHRGKRNEPAYTCLVLQRLSDLTGVSKEEIAAITNQNVIQLFKLNIDLNTKFHEKDFDCSPDYNGL